MCRGVAYDLKEILEHFGSAVLQPSDNGLHDWAWLAELAVYNSGAPQPLNRLGDDGYAQAGGHETDDGLRLGRFLLYAQAEAGVLAERNNLVEQDGRDRPREHDGGLAGQPAYGDAGWRAGQRVASGDGGDHALPHYATPRKPLLAERGGEKPGAERSVKELRDLGVAHQLAQLQLHMRVVTPELSDDCRQCGVLNRRNEADCQLSRFATPGLLHQGARRVQLDQDAVSFVEQDAAGLGQLDAPVRTMKKRRAQSLLQRADLHAERRLRQVQLVRRAPEVKLLGHGEEVAKSPGVHINTIIESIRRNKYIGLRPERRPVSPGSENPMTKGLDIAQAGGWDGRPPARFSIAVAQSVLEDLRARLNRTRWPDEIPGSGWRYGADLSYLRALVDYWANRYDWRAQEAALNQFEQFTVRIDGIDLHFIHERGEGDNPLPLLLTHGWPGSIAEFQRLIPLLTKPSRFGGSSRDAFTIVAPSMPGYGLSFKPNQRRFGLAEIADTFSLLMSSVLGYRRFAAHGHDWGAFVSSRLGYAHADKLIGIHITLLAIPRQPMPEGGKTPEERAFQAQLEHWLREETGYSLMMGTKPQTLACALTDSPVGLAAWIIEKFRTWSDCGGDLDSRFSKDLLLTNIMLYWVTGAINSSFWPYYARHHEPWIVPSGETIDVPTGYAEHPREILTPPRSLAERMYSNIQRWTRMPAGGHFPSLEAPEALAEEIRGFFRELR